MPPVDDIEALFLQHGPEQCSGEPVTQLRHALQAAALAEGEGADDELVTAALLHDLWRQVQGQGEAPTLRSVDDLLHFSAIPSLRGRFSARLLGSVQVHVDAMRHLCATRPGHLQAMSAESQCSLHLQGGVFGPAQAHFIGRAQRCALC